ncbi:hypothetical protein LTS18_013499 [Coniosporium uncinatum]|uniref:Uncharacterized protein n=1 Tax=Coniosporium uncinatum TaxID=93489 RepID=A0ACC3DW50_9PEZI|nr:hypothetical protein LTS18_013499 [Coniosporium uncinatum]
MSVSWGEKTLSDVDFSLESDMSDLNNDFLATEDNSSIIDLRQYTALAGDSNRDSYGASMSRRMSESGYSISDAGPLAEMPTYDEYSASEGLSYASDCEAWSNLDTTPNVLSPTSSPRHSFHETMRNGARARPSPISLASSRGAPYAMDSGRNKHWSTGTYAAPQQARQLNQYHTNRYSFYGSPLNPHHSMPPTYPVYGMNDYQPHNHNVLYSQPPQMQSGNTAPYPSSDQPFAPEISRALPSQGLFRLLQSNADRHTGCTSHFTDLSDPPDLYSSLHETPCDPPESDMTPTDPDLQPHEQDLRFVGDLYTPKWVRGHGNKREGWCGLCKPGRWLVLKNSAFWYDKSFTHGVSAATGAAFNRPQDTRRTEGNLDVWEGLCGSCGEWIALVSSKKKGTTWFRHAYKCHTHSKVKDGPKRRRETTSQIRARGSTTPSASNSASSASLTRQNTISESANEDNDFKRPSTSSSGVYEPATSRSLKRERELTPVNSPRHEQYSYNPNRNHRHSMLITPAMISQGTLNPLDTFAGMI